jgi:predicted nucleic acid-binding Zn finger protein
MYGAKVQQKYNFKKNLGLFGPWNHIISVKRAKQKTPIKYINVTIDGGAYV